MIKKNFFKNIALFALIAGLFAVVACKKPREVTGVSLNKSTLELVVGTTETLTATISPDNADNKDITWASSNIAVATVENGKVNALATGEATITVTTADGGKTASCVITVVAAAVHVESVSLDVDSIKLEVSQTATLNAEVLPVNATNKTVRWSSNHADIASVDSNGMITALAEGVATITVTTVDGEKTAVCTVTVEDLHPLLGKVSFRTAQTWTVGTQTWSDVVMASGCKKDDFDGGYYNGEHDYEFYADCRQNPGYGDVYSWIMMNENAETLCPNGWRVPTKDDYIALDLALGGNGDIYTNPTIRDKYLNQWGGEYGGCAVSPSGVLSNQTYCGFYWANSEYDDKNAHRLAFCIAGEVGQLYGGKDYGGVVRCVK